MDWSEDSDAVIDLINDLEQGERVRLVADEAIATDEGFVRGDATAIDDTGTVVGDGTEVELDDTVIQYQDDSHAASTVDLLGEQVVANWEYVGDSDDAPFAKPADSTFGMLRTIELVDE